MTWVSDDPDDLRRRTARAPPRSPSRSRSASASPRSRISSESFSRTRRRTASWQVAWQIWSKSGAEIVKTNFSGALDPERHQDVDVRPDVVAGRDLDRRRVERRLAGRDDVADDDPRRDEVVAGPEGPVEPAAAGGGSPASPPAPGRGTTGRPRGRSAGRRARGAPPRSASSRSSEAGRARRRSAPAIDELVADPEGLLRQDDDRQAAGGVRRRRAPRRRPASGTRTWVSWIASGRRAGGRRSPSAVGPRRSRRGCRRPWVKPLLGQGWATGATAGGGVDGGGIGGGGTAPVGRRSCTAAGGLSGPRHRLVGQDAGRTRRLGQPPVDVAHEVDDDRDDRRRQEEPEDRRTGRSGRRPERGSPGGRRCSAAHQPRAEDRRPHDPGDDVDREVRAGTFGGRAAGCRSAGIRPRIVPTTGHDLGRRRRRSRARAAARTSGRRSAARAGARRRRAAPRGPPSRRSPRR